MHVLKRIAIFLLLSTATLFASANEIFTEPNKSELDSVKTKNAYEIGETIYFAKRHSILKLALTKEKLENNGLNELSLPGFDGEQIRLKKNSLEKFGDHLWVWKGVIENSYFPDKEFANGVPEEIKHLGMNKEQLKEWKTSVRIYFHSFDENKKTGELTSSVFRPKDVSLDPLTTTTNDLNLNAFYSASTRFSVRTPEGDSRSYSISHIENNPKYQLFYEVDSSKGWVLHDNHDTENDREHLPSQKELEYKEYLRQLKLETSATSTGKGEVR